MIRFCTHLFIALLLVTAILLNSCSENSIDVINHNNNVPDTNAKALVAVVENSDIVGFSDENLYNMYKYSITPVLSAIFSTTVEKLNPLSLGEMLEKYGEPWEIQQIQNAAKGFYSKVIILNNDNATFSGLLDSLSSLKDKFTIDLILNIHGSPNSVVLTDGEILIGKLTDAVKERNVKIRSVYQTCCYGKYLAGYWSSIGVTAVNGAAGYNVLTLYSTTYFLNEWLNQKKTFEEAVSSAYNMEILKLRSYDTLFPVDTYILTPSNLNTSLQSVGGTDKNLLWKQIP